MLFADDSLIFCRAQAQKCHAILDILQKYERVSGQTINFQMPAIIFTKDISPALKEYVIQTTDIKKVGGFGKYLGLPEHIGKNKYDTFSYVYQRISKKVEN